MYYKHHRIKENEVDSGTFFSRIRNYIQSSREISIQKENTASIISFFRISTDDIRQNRNMGLFLIVGFGILPIFGFLQVLLELLTGSEVNDYTRYYMYYLLFFYWIPPGAVFIFLIMPLFSIRTIIMESGRLTVLDRFFGGDPKIKKRFLKNDIKEVSLAEMSFINKITARPKDESLFLIHEQGKYDLLSGHPLEDIHRVKSTIEDYLH